MRTQHGNQLWGELRSFLTQQASDPGFNLVFFRLFLMRMEQEGLLPPLEAYLSTVVPYTLQHVKDKPTRGDLRLISRGLESHFIPYVLPFMQTLKVDEATISCLREAMYGTWKYEYLRNLPQLQALVLKVESNSKMPLCTSSSQYLTTWLCGRDQDPPRLDLSTSWPGVLTEHPWARKFPLRSLTHTYDARRSWQAVEGFDLSTLNHLTLINLYSTGALSAYLARGPLSLKSLNVKFMAQRSSDITIWQQYFGALAREVVPPSTVEKFTVEVPLSGDNSPSRTYERTYSKPTPLKDVFLEWARGGWSWQG